jgi:hypothetical protein
MEKHSKLPWFVMTHPNPGFGLRIVAPCPSDPEPDGEMYVAQDVGNPENAAFIVRACNSYYQMLEALRHADMEWRLHWQLTDSARKIRAAIQSAEGGGEAQREEHIRGCMCVVCDAEGR